MPKTIAAIFIVLIALVSSVKSYGIDEGNYEVELQTKVIPFYNQHAQDYTYKVQGKNIVVEYLDLKQDKLLVIFPGRTEPSKKYQEVAYDLKDYGHDFLIVNHRAQGLSERLLKDTQKGYIKNFDDYVKSALVAIDETLKNKNYQSVTLLAHSMGAPIGLKIHLERTDLFHKIILSSPMLDILTGKYSESQAILLTKTLTFLGLGTKYVQGHGPSTPASREFRGNQVTQSPQRWFMARSLEEQDNFLIMGGATNRWTYQSLKHTKNLEKDYGNLKHIPLLIFTAGIEFYTKNERVKLLCSLFKDNCDYTHFPDALHELFQERDEFRDIVIKKVKNFL